MTPSRVRDLIRIFRIIDLMDFAAFTIRKFFRVIEAIALPILALGTIALVLVATSRAIAWSAMTPLITSPKDRIAAENQIFVTLGQILGGGFILTGLYFTGKSYILTRRGQFGERLGGAIEGLGDSNLQRRVSSIISIGAMMSDERQSVSTVINVLCAFVRTETAADTYSAQCSDGQPRADIQAAISLIGRVRRRTAWWNLVQIDLRKSVLSKVDFSDGDFRQALFQDCDLVGSNFFRARLAGANFSRATLSHGNFNQSDLRRVTFYTSIAPHCTFRRSNMVNTILTTARFTKCSFDGARIIKCTFGQTELEGSTFRGIRIRGCEFFGVDPEIEKAMHIG